MQNASLFKNYNASGYFSWLIAITNQCKKHVIL